MSGSECLANNMGEHNKRHIHAGYAYAPRQQLAVVPPPVTQAIGVDIVDIQRLQALYDRWQDTILNRIFTEQEQNICRHASGYRWQSLAGRFSAKEAVKKILGSHGEIAGWTEIEIVNGQYGEPYIKLHGRAQSALERLGYTNLILSISHEASLAIATVIAY